MGEAERKHGTALGADSEGIMQSKLPARAARPHSRWPGSGAGPAGRPAVERARREGVPAAQRRTSPGSSILL